MSEFTDNSRFVLGELNRAVNNALEAIGFAAESHAKEETPVDTGRLRNSMAHSVKGDSAYIGTNVEYGPYVENGSIHNTAHHMIQRAATQHSDEYKRIAKQYMK